MKPDRFVEAADLLNELIILARAADQRVERIQAAGYFADLSRERFRIGGIRRQLKSVVDGARELREKAVSRVETVVVTEPKGVDRGT